MENYEPKQDKKKQNTNGFKFNPNWLYGILFVILMAMLFLPQNSGQSTKWRDVKAMILQGDVKKLVIQNERIVNVYLTKEAIQQKRYKNAKPRQDLMGTA